MKMGGLKSESRKKERDAIKVLYYEDDSRYTINTSLFSFIVNTQNKHKMLIMNDDKRETMPT